MAIDKKNKVEKVVKAANLMNNIKDLDIKIILSGGINIKNVDNAIDINPWCIDINSGVESSPGFKDINLTNKLIEKI